MKGKINRDWYCTGYANDPCPDKDSCSGCLNYHRKWPTPEQFREEYGEDWKGGVYICFDFKSEFESKWELRWYYERGYFPNSPIVCACTPWGKPPSDWRPE